MAQVGDAANAPYRLLHALQLMSSGMFSAVYETRTVTCLVEVKAGHVKAVYVQVEKMSW